MGVPLIVKSHATPAGTTTDALSTHVDLATTLVAAGGATLDSMSGEDLAPVLADPSTSVREAVLFAQDSAQSEGLADVRYAVRGFFDGTTKYARYYGQGGGIRRDGAIGAGTKRVDVDAAFEDQEHEWYDMAEDPHELRNRAIDAGLGAQSRVNFDRLIELETANGML